MTRKNVQPLKPLRHFDFGLIVKKLEGLYFNIDRDLERRISQAVQAQNAEADRVLSLLHMMFRFTWNSYCATCYLAADIPEDINRRPSYVMVVPAINRQLLDLLFSLAYMLDDVSPRSLAYQRAGWREVLDEHTLQKNSFSSDPEWQPHFGNVKGVLESMAAQFGITDEQKKSPESVDYWPTPTQLKDYKTPCRQFLRYLEEWLYRDTSTQAHLSFAGLFPLIQFLVSEKEVPEQLKNGRQRTMKMYHFHHVSRTALIFLAVSTEIDTYCHLQNNDTVDYLWKIFGEHVAEAKEMWDVRYAKRFLKS